MTPTQAEIDAYHADGAVCLRGVISPEWIERLRDGVAADMAAPGPHVEVYTADSDPGLFFNDFDLWRHVPQMKAFALEGPCAQIAAALSRASTITFFYDQIFAKEPGTERPHPLAPGPALHGGGWPAALLQLDPARPDHAGDDAGVRARLPPLGALVRALRQHAGRAAAIRAPSSSAARTSSPRATTTTSSRGSWSPGIASSSRGWWCTRAATT